MRSLQIAESCLHGLYVFSNLVLTETLTCCRLAVKHEASSQLISLGNSWIAIILATYDYSYNTTERFVKCNCLAGRE